MSDDLLNIEINGKPLKARKGEMIIKVADEAGITIPRFCYHKKLSIAANCRMCLVEVEKAPKPLPACATPVMDGMKVFTDSTLAIEAQKGVMEFLLINHPLDCPICDQGGECELQDLAMGYGGGVSRYTESKRVVKDKDIGPLVSTDMTRCIHCTRCVRFGEEVAGLRELGATGRGEFLQIGTYVEKTMSSEMSGNVIDLCPVGALNAKPSRFTGRAWEMVQSASIAPHDCMGSNIYMHTIRGKVKRVVPRDNELINETWISDRDRFSYQGILSDDRLSVPMIKEGNNWVETDWETALRVACEGIKQQINSSGPNAVAAWAASHSTLEELYLLQKLMRGLGSANIDHRFRQLDFSDQSNAPVMPWLGKNIEELDKQDAILLVASNVRKEQPIACHRIRKAAMKGADIFFVNGRRYDWHFPVAQELAVSPPDMVNHLAAVLKSLAKLTKEKLPPKFQEFVDGVDVSAQHKKIAIGLNEATNAMVILGSQAVFHPNLSVLRLLSSQIAKLAKCSFGYLPESSNAPGAWLAGCLPHRRAAGEAVSGSDAGLNFEQMIDKGLSAYLLLNVEPECDSVNPQKAIRALERAQFVVSMTPFITSAMKQYADVLLPIGTFAETSGTFVNAEGRWQSFAGGCKSEEYVKPAWRVLRVMGNLFQLEGFKFNSSEDVKRECQSLCQAVELNNNVSNENSIAKIKTPRGLLRVSDVALYSNDGIQRRAMALQETNDAINALKVVINEETAAKYKLKQAKRVNVIQDDCSIVMDLQIDGSIPNGCAWIAQGTKANEQLGSGFGLIKLEAV